GAFEDAEHFALPDLLPRQERACRSVYYHRSARASARVVVPSAFVRCGAVGQLGLDPAHVRVIPHGIDHSRFSPSDDERESFLLYPARAWPHKNHARLYAAFSLLRRDLPDLRLVLTGGGHSDVVPDRAEGRGDASHGELVSR